MKALICNFNRTITGAWAEFPDAWALSHALRRPALPSRRRRRWSRVNQRPTAVDSEPARIRVGD